MFRAVIVAAVSTPAQATEDKGSIPHQIMSCEECCQRNGWEIVATVQIPGHSRNYVYLDEITADCPQYAELLRIIRSGAVNLVVTAYYSRLWRTQELQSAFMAVCHEHDVQVYSVTEGGSLRPPGSGRVDSTSKFIASVHGYTAEHENEVRRQRHESGMRNRILSGLPGNNGTTPYGYRPPPGPRQPPILDEREAYWVRWIFERRAEGWGGRRIVTALDDMGVPPPSGNSNWSHNSVTYILKNDFYVGVVRWGRYSNPNGLHEPIISMDLWRRAQVENGRRSTAYNKAVNQLSGLCRCGFCGRAMVYSGYTRYPKREALRCCRYLNSRGLHCTSNRHSVWRVEAAVKELIRELLADPETYWRQRQTQREEEMRNELAAVEAEIASLEKRYQRLLDALEGGYIDLPTFGARVVSLDTSRLVARRDELRESLARSEIQAERIVSLHDVADRLDDLSDEELNRVYRMLIDRIELRKGEPPRVILL